MFLCTPYNEQRITYNERMCLSCYSLLILCVGDTARAWGQIVSGPVSRLLPSPWRASGLLLQRPFHHDELQDVVLVNGADHLPVFSY